MAAKSLIRQLAGISWLGVTRRTNFVVQKNTTHNTSVLAVATSLTYPNMVNLSKRYCTHDCNIPIVTFDEIKKCTKCGTKQSAQLLIDVREPEELQETGKIPTSINIPLGEVCQELAESKNKAAFKTKYNCEKPEKNAVIIFYCKSGKRSQKAAELARSLGYKNVKNYLGSWMEYAEKEGLPK